MKTIKPDISHQAEYWDWWEDTRSINKWSQRRANLILDFIKTLQIKDKNILDLGCGSGWFSNMLLPFGAVTAIDLSQIHMQAAKVKNPNINFIYGDIFTYPLEENHYDLVVSQQVIAHVPDQQQYVRIAANILKPEGWLVISTNNKFVMDRLGEEYVDHKLQGHIENWLSRAELEKLLKDDFTILKKISLIPRGSRGILRILNSHKLNKFFELLLSKKNVEMLKEKAGLGYVNVFFAQKK